MAPERFSGQGDLRSDVYSLGLTLYEMLARCGRPSTRRTAASWSSRSCTTSRCGRASSTRRAARPGDGGAQGDRPRPGPPLPDPRRDGRRPANASSRTGRSSPAASARRRSSGAGAGATPCRPAAGAAGRCLPGGFRGCHLAALRDAGRAARPRRRKRKAAEEARDVAQKQTERAATTLYYSQLARVRLEWQANNVTDALRFLELCDRERRGWEWQFLNRVCHSELLTLEGNTGWIVGVAYSPDGKVIATAGTGNPFHAGNPERIQPGEIILWDAATGRQWRT